MLHMILEKHYLLYAILATGLIGLISRMVLSRVIRKLLREADSMGNTSHDLLLLIRRKYEAVVMVNRSIKNTEVFVERYLRRYQVGGMTLKRIGSITYEMMLCSMILGCIGGVGAYFDGMELSQIILYPAASVLTVMLLLFCEAFLEMDGRMEQLKLIIIDYLDNAMEPRLRLQGDLENLKRDNQGGLHKTGEKEESGLFSSDRESVSPTAFGRNEMPGTAASEVTVALAWESPEEEELVKEVIDEYLT